MIIGVDIGGTKTLLGIFDKSGSLVKENRFETTRKQDEFEENLRSGLNDIVGNEQIEAVCVASPGQIEDGVILWAGPNLGWKNFALSDILGHITNAPVYIENDANLAALAEARALNADKSLILYITLSTGVGSGVIVDGKLLHELSGSEAGQMYIYNEDGNFVKWEDIASGKSLTERAGMRAESITDPEVWQQYAKDVCLGLQPTINVLRPQKVVLGGGVGVYADKFSAYLKDLVAKQIDSQTYEAPEILAAHYGERSVIYGCYEYAKDHLPA